jgi:hypothetical protein
MCDVVGFNHPAGICKYGHEPSNPRKTAPLLSQVVM